VNRRPYAGGRGSDAVIYEEDMNEMVERARALGTDYAVLSDLLRLIAEVRRLRGPVDAGRQLNAERLRFNDADQPASQHHQGSGRRKPGLELPLGWC